jgi:hypothetical protein
MARVLLSTAAPGVRQSLRHVVAGRDITIWEMDVTNPCPADLSRAVAVAVAMSRPDAAG